MNPISLNPKKRKSLCNATPEKKNESDDLISLSEYRISTITPIPLPGNPLSGSLGAATNSQVNSEPVGTVADALLSTSISNGNTLNSRLTVESLRQACAFLAASDPHLERLITEHGPPERLAKACPGATGSFAALSKSICFQQ